MKKSVKIFGVTAAAFAALALSGCIAVQANETHVGTNTVAVDDISPIAATAENLKATPAGIYEADTTHTKVIWRVTHMGFSNYTAALNGVNATLDFNADDVTKSKVNVTIDANAVDTGMVNFDKEIADLFFESAKYPTIKFVSTNLVKTGDVTGIMTGDLTFHGVTKPVALKVKFNGSKVHPMNGKQAVGFSAVGSFKRSDFGVDKYVPMVGDDVNLIIETEFHKK